MSIDRKRRSLVKSITWRIIGIAIMPIIIYLVYRFIGTDVGNVALWSTAIFHGIRIVLYYYHERIWERIRWGRISRTDSATKGN